MNLRPLLFRQLFDRESSTYTYLLADADTRQAVLIDPVVGQTDRDLKLLSELELTLRYTLDTHVHADHVTGAGVLREATDAQSALAAAAGVDCVDVPLSHGDRLRFGQHEIEVRATPGHTNGCLTYVVRTANETLAFTGDALLVRGCGRTDFQQGSAATLYASVHEQIFSLGDATIYPAHDYRGHTRTTVAEERRHNPRLRDGVGQAQFVAIMENLKLADPKLMDVAVPANMGCGVPVLSDAFSELPPAAIDLDRYRLMDVRSAAEFGAGHMFGAELLPVDTLPGSASGWSKTQPILAVCSTGIRSALAATKLTEAGFEDVTNLAGGMEAWRNWKAKQ